MLQVKRESQVTFLRCPALDDIPRVVHAFSTRQGPKSDFTLGPITLGSPIIQANRDCFLTVIGAPGWPVQRLKQVHSAVVCEMDDISCVDEAVEGDAAVTALAGIMLAVQTADCVPILIADTKARAVAAIHAGWRGTATHITELTIARVEKKFAIKPSDLTAAIGPHIGVCCYEVGEDVVNAIDDRSAFEYRREWVRPHLDLAGANRKQLLEAGLSPDRILTSFLCTQCRADSFFSYRREGPHTGRMLSAVGIAP
jgi:YfiH family protein